MPVPPSWRWVGYLRGADGVWHAVAEASLPWPAHGMRYSTTWQDGDKLIIPVAPPGRAAASEEQSGCPARPRSRRGAAAGTSRPATACTEANSRTTTAAWDNLGRCRRRNWRAAPTRSSARFRFQGDAGEDRSNGMKDVINLLANLLARGATLRVERNA